MRKILRISEKGGKTNGEEREVNFLDCTHASFR